MSDRPQDNEPEFNPEMESNPEAGLPFGMAGVTGLLDRLQDAFTGDKWAPRKRQMVAQYLIDMSTRYWMSEDEISFCELLAEPD